MHVSEERIAEGFQPINLRLGLRFLNQSDIGPAFAGTPAAARDLSRRSGIPRKRAMRVPAWLRQMFGGERRPEDERRVRIRRPEEGPQATGDMRGSYGFGRRAHRPDPKGHYGFDNDANYLAHRPSG
jgi:hypothetical protein